MTWEGTLTEIMNCSGKPPRLCHSEERSDEESFSTEVRRSFAFAQDDIERSLDSVSDTLSCYSDFDGYGISCHYDFGGYGLF